MNGWAFPLLGALVVFLLAVPLATLAAKLLLVLRRARTQHLPLHGSTTTWLLLVTPVLAPVPWFASAALHQSEPGPAIAACLYDHLGATPCHDALLLAGGLAATLLAAFTRRVHHELPAGAPAPARDPATSTAARRLDVLTVRHPRLRELRVVLVDGPAAPLCTRGLLRPRVEISAHLVHRLDDDALTAALLHEAAHDRARDPLRFFLAAVCLSLNPLAALLRAELARWRLAREAACDRAAVRDGADPLALAHAIVATAAPAPPTPATVAALRGDGASGVRLRVSLLLAYAKRPPTPAKGPAALEAPIALLGATLAVLVTLPHAIGTGPLDLLHLGIERALAPFGLP